MNPILVLAASSTCPPGYHRIPGGTPPAGRADALALAVPGLVPLAASALPPPAQTALFRSLPPFGFVPDRTEEAGEPSKSGIPCARFFGQWFATSSLEFVRRHHPGVRWAPGAAEGFGTVTELDLLHGWIGARCVAVLLRCVDEEAPDAP